MSSAMQSNTEQPLTGVEQGPSPPAPDTHVCTIPPGVTKSQQAYYHDLPELLKDRLGWWVAYHGDQRVGFARKEIDLYEECFRRGLTDEQFVVRCVMPGEPDEEVELGYSWD